MGANPFDSELGDTELHLLRQARDRVTHTMADVVLTSLTLSRQFDAVAAVREHRPRHGARSARDP